MTQSTAQQLVKALKSRAMRIALAESCTGGLIASAITGIPGSSEVFDCGIVAYGNSIKTRLLGVSPKLLARHGAVSAEIVEAMARGAHKLARADIALAVSGIAGPGGGTRAKPVGLVWIGIASKYQRVNYRYKFKGHRATIRQQAVAVALDLALKTITNLEATGTTPGRVLSRSDSNSKMEC